MPGAALIENTPLFDRLLCVLEENGAGTVEGWQIHQVTLAEMVGYLNKRAMYGHLVRAKELGLIKTTAVMVTVGWGTSRRQADRYHLLMPVAQWHEAREKVVAAKMSARLVKSKRSQKVNRMELARKELGLKRGSSPKRAPAGPKPQPVPVDAEAVEALAAELGDDDLDGW